MRTRTFFPNIVMSTLFILTKHIGRSHAAFVIRNPTSVSSSVSTSNVHNVASHPSATRTMKHQSLLFSTTTSTKDSSNIVSPTMDNNVEYDNVILFDGICNFCNTWVDILLRLDINEKFKFAPLQSNVGKQLLVSIGKEEDDISSVVLVKKCNNNGDDNNTNDYYDKSGCVLQVVDELGPLGSVFSMTVENIVPRSIRDSIYDTVAENRYNFLGKRDECRCGDPKYADRFLA